MKKKVLLIDTSILTVWLDIPSFDITENKGLDKSKIDAFLDSKQKDGYTFMLPIATIIETGNHVAQIKDGNIRHQIVNEFADLLIKLARKESPWLLNSNEVKSFTSDELIELAEQWKNKGVYKLSLGDASILKVANDSAQLLTAELCPQSQKSRLHILSIKFPCSKTRF